MGTESIPILTGLVTKGNGKMTCNMAKVVKSGLTERAILDNIMKERSTVMVFISGWTAPDMKAIGMAIKSQGLGLTCGQMGDATKANG